MERKDNYCSCGQLQRWKSRQMSELRILCFHINCMLPIAIAVSDITCMILEPHYGVAPRLL
jgi:hypothetical protein